MKNNKYLRELGIEDFSLPGNYIPKTSFRIRLKRRWYKIKRGFCYMFNALESKAPEYDNYFESPIFDKGNKEDKEGFCDYEFFSLDYTLALYLYSKLCYFRDNCMHIGTPCCFCFNEDGSNKTEEESTKAWADVINKMILSFKLIIIEPDWNEIEELDKIQEQIKEGLHLFAEYFQCLWY